MTSKMDEILEKVLKDKDIFSPNGDFILFNEKEWEKLKGIFKKFIENKSEEEKKIFIEKVNEAKDNIQNQNKKHRQDGMVKKLELMAEWLEKAIDEKPNLLKRLFENLGWYGLVRCNLPNMNNYGKVIERYNISTVEQYFLDNIKKRQGNPKERIALGKVLEYVEELYNAGVSREEIAYFVRKLNSLAKYWEIIEFPPKKK